MSQIIGVGILQCGLGDGPDRNIARVEDLIRQAAAQGAQVIVPPELFESTYFPQHEREECFALARPVSEHPTLARCARLARELEVVIPASFFERDGPHYYNSVAIFDADGRRLGVYRKSHIPDGPGYEEKFYFRPGHTGFCAWTTRYGRIGVGICWDQWFPECARAMALDGAEILLYPTAIGSEPEQPELNTKKPWQRVMVGHAVANAMPVAASNRVGQEDAIRFYGSSFIADASGERIEEMSEDEQGVRVAKFDRAALRAARASWGFFRDRRPELYDPLSTRR